MSSNFALRSLGHPYFCLAQNDLTGMGATSDIFNGHDVIEGYVTLEIHALPQQAASADELHKVWSLHEYPTRSGFTWVGTEFLSIAVTPSGRLVATAFNGAVAQTGPGFLAPNSGLRQYRAHFVGSVGTLLLHELFPISEAGFQESQLLAAGVGATGVVPAVTAGRHAQVMLFNGYGALTRMPCSIRNARLETGSMSPSWGFYEGAGGEVAFAGAQDPAFPDVTRDFNLDAAIQAHVIGSVFDPLPWGEYAGPSIDKTYRWELRTEYQRDDPALPEYTRELQ